MNKYNVEWTHGSLVYSRIIEASSLQHAKMMVATDDIFNDGEECITITEVHEYRIMWIEHHSWEGFATNEDDAEHKAIEYAETQNTFEEYGGFDVEEIESDRPEIEVIEEHTLHYNSMTSNYAFGVYEVLSDD